MNFIPGNSIVREFEYRVADICGSRHCLSVANATTGILGVFYALGLSNAEIISTPLTWSGAFTGLQMLNCKIKFCDIEQENLTVDPEQIETLISQKTKAVFSADFLGYPARLDLIKEICNKHNLLLIHDAASSFGSKYKGNYSGYYADVSIISFGVKKIFSIGEGGCILTESDEIFNRIERFLKHPTRQSMECDGNNPFALNTRISPFAAEYALKTIDKKISNIKTRHEQIVTWLRKYSAFRTHPTDEPNFYRMFASEYLQESQNSKFRIDELPFKSLIYNEKHFEHSCLSAQPNCPVAEKAIKQRKLISFTRWS